MIRILLLLIISGSFIYSLSNIDEFNSSDFNNIDFYLDPYHNTQYKLDLFYPNYIPDYSYDILKVDGSMNNPVGNFIPKDLFISFNDSTHSDLSQITIIQDKQIKFFDTSVAYKGRDVNQVKYTGIIESKSISSNLNQNYFLSIESTHNKSIDFKTAYLYHYEDIPIYNLDNSLKYSRMNESFVGGVYVDCYLDKLTLNASMNFHYGFNKGSYNNDILEFDSKISWAEIKVDYEISKRLSFYYDILHKANVSDSLGSKWISSNFRTNDLGVNYKFRNWILSSGLFLDNKDNVDFIYKVKFINNLIDVELTKSSTAYMELSDDLVNEFVLQNSQINKTELLFALKFYEHSQKLSIGEVLKDDYASKYLIYNGSFNFNQLKFDYILTHYENQNFIFKNYAKYTATYYPYMKSKTFVPFIKISGHYLNLNSSYIIDNGSIDFFNTTNLNQDIYNDFNVITGEIGVIFNSFKIAFEQRNLLNDYEYYSSESYPIYPVNYMLSVIWKFQD